MYVAQVWSHKLLCAGACAWMNPGKIVADRVNDHQRDVHPEGRALIDAATERDDRSAVHLDELPGDGQTQTESTALRG